MNDPLAHYRGLASQSELVFKHGLHVGTVVIDRDYKGEIKVLLFNLSQSADNIHEGQHVAQLIF